MIYTKVDYPTIYNSLTDNQKTLFGKVVVLWNQKKIEIDDTEFLKLPTNIQTRLRDLIAKEGYN